VFTKQESIQLNTTDVSISVTRCHPEAKIPTRGSSDSAGWDLYSTHDVTIQPGHRTLINTGIAIQLPEGTYSRIAPHSGLAWKQGLTVGVGVIDRDYRGEIGVLLFNQGQSEVTLEKGTCIAQMIIERYNHDSVFREVQEVMEMERAEKGFGSTGIHTMEPDLVEIYAVDLMLTATQETLQNMIPKYYHEFLPLADPEGPLRGLPPL
jgi:dUTP pyrophosphatase